MYLDVDMKDPLGNLTLQEVFVSYTLALVHLARKDLDIKLADAPESIKTLFKWEFMTPWYMYKSSLPSLLYVIWLQMSSKWSPGGCTWGVAQSPTLSFLT